MVVVTPAVLAAALFFAERDVRGEELRPYAKQKWLDGYGDLLPGAVA